MVEVLVGGRSSHRGGEEAALLKRLVSLQVPPCFYRFSQRAIGLLRPVFDLDLSIFESDLVHWYAIVGLAICLVGSHEHIG
jgi:hypothetical protein